MFKIKAIIVIAFFYIVNEDVKIEITDNATIVKKRIITGKGDLNE